MIKANQLTERSELILPGWKVLERQLNRSRRHLVQTDEHGCMEALFCLDMFRAAVEPGLSRGERVRKYMYFMAWLSAYIRDAGDGEVPEGLREKAEAIYHVLRCQISEQLLASPDEEEVEIEIEVDRPEDRL